MDAGYKTPWIAKRTLEDDRIPVLPYTRKNYKDGTYRPWEYTYDPVTDSFICPHRGILRHTTTDKDGRRTYRTDPKQCMNCPYKAKCGANERGQKVLQTHIWQEYLDIVEQVRLNPLGKKLYAKRKETIERVFADAKEKHAMRYTHHRSLARVERWVRLKFATRNTKKLANCSWKTPPRQPNQPYFAYSAIHARACAGREVVFDRLKGPDPSAGSGPYAVGFT